MSEDTNDPSGCTEPSVFLDQTVLSNSSQQLQPVPKGPQYTVNESTYNEEEKSDEATNVVKLFKLYAERTTNISQNTFVPLNDEDVQYVYCSSPESDKFEVDPSSTTELNIVIQKASNGLIINSNVYLTDDQWNTLMYYDGHLLRCVACQMVIDIENCAYHVQRDSHRGVLDRCRPLARFDLSITRRIRNQYHCAVCNEAFNLDEEMQHFASKSHEGNLLSAINKVSDLDLTENDDNVAANRNNDTYHFNASAINNARNNGNENNDCNFNSNMINDDDSNGSYEDDEVYEYAVDDNDYDDEYDSLWGVVEQKPQRTGSSYATMLKKPKIIDLPMFLEKDLGDKKVKVRFDSYHMLIKPKVNRFYCMVCKDYSHIREQSKHCSDPEHLKKLNLCEVVDSFGDYFIRVMDDKLYHCGHCNNLVVKNDMADHLEDKHSKKPTNAIESGKKCVNATKNRYNGSHDVRAVENGNDKSNTDNNVENKNIKVTNENKQSNLDDKIENKSNDVKKNDNNNDINKNNNLPGTAPWLYDVIVINPFGYGMAISMLSYNVVLKRPYYADFYCGLCDLTCAEETVLPHIHGILHLQMLQRTPFILPFNCNLIRAVREKLHCAICNLPITVQEIYTHIGDPFHLKLLEMALKINVKQPLVKPLNHAQNNAPTAPNNSNDKTEVTKTKVDIQNRPTPPPTPNNDAAKIKTQEPLPAKETTKPAETPATKKETILTEIPLTENADEMELLLNDSIESIDLDLEDYVYVKIKNTYFKITITSYNTLVHIGDGTRYCFVCSTKVTEEELKRHVESRQHVNNIKDSKFVDKFENTLLRQIFLMYHCSICNVLITRRELKNHLTWSPHTEETNAMMNISKKSRKNDLKAGKALHVANVTKDLIYLNEKEPEVTVLYRVAFSGIASSPFVKKNKIVILSGDVLKIDFDNWNGVIDVRGMVKCQLCQVDFSPEDLGRHVRGLGHAASLGKDFKEGYLEHLLRQVNDTTLHCVYCNAEVSDKPHAAHAHVSGRRHRIARADVRARSAAVGAYGDCDDDPAQL